MCRLFCLSDDRQFCYCRFSCLPKILSQTADNFCCFFLFTEKKGRKNERNCSVIVDCCCCRRYCGTDRQDSLSLSRSSTFHSLLLLVAAAGCACASTSRAVNQLTEGVRCACCLCAVLRCAGDAGGAVAAVRACVSKVGRSMDPPSRRQPLLLYHTHHTGKQPTPFA